MIERDSRSLDFCGFSALSDLTEDDCRAIYAKLEKDQAEFLSWEEHFRSSDYRWPRDPLHTWSRMWEYPYVWHHLKKIHEEKGRHQLLRTTDIGSGVTFFPFSVARLGYEVNCVDVDPVCVRDIPLAAKFIDSSPGNVAATLSDGRAIPLPSETQDVVYCVSVLEHIPDFGNTLTEITRVLKPQGKFILTVDIDLRGDSELGGEEFRLLQRLLAENFEPMFQERSIHPALLLTSENSRFPYVHQSVTGLAKSVLRGLLQGQPLSRKPRICQYLTVYACVLSRR